MEKIIRFFVKVRYVIFALVILSMLAGCLTITRIQRETSTDPYYPETAGYHDGESILKEQLPEDVWRYTNIRCMFQKLPEEYRDRRKEEMERLPNVKSVNYEKEDTAYNKGDYCLYEVVVPFEADSKEVKKVVKRLQRDYGNDPVTKLTLEVEGKQEEMGTPWLIFVGVGFLIILLIILCRSYVEVGIVLLSLGIMTFLQVAGNGLLGALTPNTLYLSAGMMALIGLPATLYFLEKFDVKERMIFAKGEMNDWLTAGIRRSFPGIAMIFILLLTAGLALMFMSEEVGKEMGLNMIKGGIVLLVVLYGLLPSLVNWCYSLFFITAKPAPRLSLGKWGKVLYKGRYVALGILTVTLIAGWFGKERVQTSLLLKEKNETINKIFEPENTVQVLYDNDVEDKVNTVLDDYAQREKVKTITSYHTTLGKAYTASELQQQLKELHVSDVEGLSLNADLIRMMYNYHFSQDSGTCTVGDFFRVMADDIFQNKNFAHRVDAVKASENKERYLALSNETQLSTPRDVRWMAYFTNMKVKKCAKVYLYYMFDNEAVTAGALTLPEFARFLVEDYPKLTEFSSLFDNDSIKRIQAVRSFTDEKYLKTGQPYTTMASSLGITEEVTQKLYIQSYKKNPSRYRFKDLQILLQRMNQGGNPYQDVLNTEKIGEYRGYTDPAKYTAKLSPGQLASMFGLPTKAVTELYFREMKEKQEKKQAKNPATPAPTEAPDSVGEAQASAAPAVNPDVALRKKAAKKKMSPLKFSQYFRKHAKDYSETASYLTTEKDGEILKIQKKMKMVLSKKTYDYQEAAKLYEMDAEDMKSIYGYYEVVVNKRTLTVKEVMDKILKDEAKGRELVGDKNYEQLKDCKELADISLKKVIYDVPAMAKLVDMDEDQVRQLYYIHGYKKQDTGGWMMSPRDFVRYVRKEAIQGKRIPISLSKSKKKKLRNLDIMISTIIAKDAYGPEEMTELLADYTDQFGPDTVKLFYYYYNSKYNNDTSKTLSLMEFMDVVAEEAIHDPIFTGLLGAEDESKITKIKEELGEQALRMKGVDYSLATIRTNLEAATPETMAYMQVLNEGLRENAGRKNFYLIGDSALIYKLSRNSSREENVILAIGLGLGVLILCLLLRNVCWPLVLGLGAQAATFIGVFFLGRSVGQIFVPVVVVMQGVSVAVLMSMGVPSLLEYRKKQGAEGLQEVFKNSGFILLACSLFTPVWLWCLQRAAVDKMSQQMFMGLKHASVVWILFLWVILPAGYTIWHGRKKRG